jgi:hypothetical protein
MDMRFLFFPVVWGLSGCSEQSLKAFDFENIAVVQGDFDSMNDVLIRLDVSAMAYEGFIAGAVYDDEIDPDLNVLKVENLLRDRNEGDQPVMNAYDAIFINSGVRGLGAYKYNNVDPDDTFLSDPIVLENVQQFVEGGGSLILSDWAGDLIEAIWPDQIDFVNEGICGSPPCWDAPQVGTSEDVLADVLPTDLQQELGTDNISLSFDFSYWTAMASVSSDVEVFLQGDIEYRISDGEGYGVLEDVPLLVVLNLGRGKIVFSSFHWRSQNPTQGNQLMLSAVEGLGIGPNANIYGDE